jgi:hypothetical protein
MLVKRRAHRLYRTQKANASRRGIDFLFKFEEWVTWWEDNIGRDWLKLRGRYKGQFKMGRKGDKGPYSKDNVICIHQEQNASDATRGKKCPLKAHPWAKGRTERFRKEFKGKGNPFYGGHHTPEAREAIRKAKLGKKQSPEACKRKSEAMKRYHANKRAQNAH